MQVIELNGLPGCGKSTLCKRILEEINSKNLSVGDLQDVVFRKQSSKLDNYSFLVKSLFSLKNFKFNIAVLKFTKDYQLNKTRLMFAMRLIKLNSKLISTINDNTYDLLILEEGFIQYITSIPHDKLIIKNKNLKNLCNIIYDQYGEHLQINCNLNYQDNISRLKNRNNINNRFDKLPVNQLKDLLNIRENNLSLLRNHFAKCRTVDIKMESDLNSNVRYLLNLINKN